MPLAWEVDAEIEARGGAMNSVVKVLLVLALGVGGHHMWTRYHTAKAPAEVFESSPGPFLHTAMPGDAKANTVLILAPVNCPSKAAKRADALAAQLTQMGIPNSRGNSFQLHVRSPSPEVQADMQRAGQILQGEIPAVFVNGMGKSNPSAEEVAAVYRETRQN
jgi:hypothetical protein